jgi:hypothetical protein
MAEQEPASGIPPVADTWTAALEALWQKQSSWSRKADELKSERGSWTGPLVVATFIGVIIGTLAPLLKQWTEQLHWPAWLPIAVGLLGTALVSISTYLSKELLGPKENQDWIAARTVAEALKAEGYIYAAGAPPYTNEATAPTLLVDRTSQLSDRSLGILPDPAADIRQRHPHAILKVDEYIQKRIRAQIRYYLDDARRYAKTLRRWRVIGITLGILSIVIGLLGAVLRKEEVTVWTAVVTTAIATVTAYVYGSRFEYLASSYFAASERLKDLITRWSVTSQRADGERHRFILDCEAVLAAQNQSWADELTRQVQATLKKDAAGPG